MDISESLQERLQRALGIEYDPDAWDKTDDEPPARKEPAAAEAWPTSALRTMVDGLQRITGRPTTADDEAAVMAGLRRIYGSSSEEEEEEECIDDPNAWYRHDGNYQGGCGEEQELHFRELKRLHESMRAKEDADAEAAAHEDRDALEALGADADAAEAEDAQSAAAAAAQCSARDVWDTTVADGSGRAMRFVNSAALREGLPDPLDPAFPSAFARRVQGTPWFAKMLEELVSGPAGSLCAGGVARLNPQQVVAHAYFAHVAEVVRASGSAEELRRRVPRGSLVFHSTGAGKTNVQMGIIDALHDLLAEGRAEVFFVTTVTNMRDNDIGVFARWAFLYPHFCRMGADAARAHMERKLGLRKDTHWLSYERMARRAVRGGKLPHRKGVQRFVVFDEAHSMFEGDGAYAREVRSKYLGGAGRNDIVIMLTATPGTTVPALMDIMQATEWDPASRAFESARYFDAATNAPSSPEAVAEFQRRSAGRVMHADLRRVTTLFPAFRVIEVKTKGLSRAIPRGGGVMDAARARRGKPNRGAGASSHAEQYYSQMLKIPAEPAPGARNTVEFDKAVDRAARVANVWDSTLRLTGGACVCASDGCPVRKPAGGVFERREHLERIAAKFIPLVDAIEAEPKDKHFVYAGKGFNAAKVARAVLCALNGLTGRYERATAIRPPPCGRRRKGDGGEGSGGGECAVSEEALTKAASEAVAAARGKRMSLTLFSPDKAKYSDERWRKMAVACWNHPDNASGDAFAVLVGAGDDLQGLSLMGTRFMHQLGELADAAKTIQLDGRAVRVCSLAGYAPEDSVVTKRVYVLDDDAAASAAEDLAARREAILLELGRANEERKALLDAAARVDAAARALSAREQGAKEALRQALADAGVADAKGLQRVRAAARALAKRAETLRAEYEALDPSSSSSSSSNAADDGGGKARAKGAKGAARRPRKTGAAAEYRGESIDALARRVADARLAPLELFYSALRQAAFDCEVMLPVNSLAHPALRCGVHPITLETVRDALARAREAERYVRHSGDRAAQRELLELAPREPLAPRAAPVAARPTLMAAPL